MNWVVDTCVVLDVFGNDPEFGLRSAKLLERKWKDGLEISPVTFVELAPAFDGDLEEQKRFLNQAGIQFPGGWNIEDTETAHEAWNRHIRERRSGSLPKRPIADLLIGAFAVKRRGLITRNPNDFRRNFPGMEIVEP
ncbi:MAG: type II toxin-antitoxin system VapC family toxin [Verrucomicrobiales bacterium]|jgi:predicted nucleic acid-binding protein|nr:type II toxin-antitoxin system VapC family toxin [Verrucomicrobiales bacterium]MBP9222341.1 type II toxin-antitoxin system VapC family toxin [Verrucomicrobiales bacterium]